MYLESLVHFTMVRYVYLPLRLHAFLFISIYFFVLRMELLKNQFVYQMCRYLKNKNVVHFILLGLENPVVKVNSYWCVSNC